MFLRKLQISKRSQVISVFVLLNLSIGLLFHKSLAVVCISELFIISVFGLVFWNIVSLTMRSAGGNAKFQLNGHNLWFHGLLGISTAMISVLMSHIVVITSMIIIYDCIYSPGFNLINTSLANNAVLNLLCYFGLAFIYFWKSESIYKKEQDESASPGRSHDDPRKLLVDSHGLRKILPADTINYIETSNNCIIIHTDDGNFVKYQSLKKFLSDLKFEPLQRIHKSYAVNLNKIVSM